MFTQLLTRGFKITNQDLRPRHHSTDSKIIQPFQQTRDQYVGLAHLSPRLRAKAQRAGGEGGGGEG
eukprot:12933706-Prorocentrum_lima.AAC.1